MNKCLLCGREWKVTGNWYESQKMLESYKSVVEACFLDTISSAGDWSGYILQKLGGWYHVIIFWQVNNDSGDGFDVYTGQVPLATANYRPTREELVKIFFGE